MEVKHIRYSRSEVVTVAVLATFKYHLGTLGVVRCHLVVLLLIVPTYAA